MSPSPPPRNRAAILSWARPPMCTDRVIGPAFPTPSDRSCPSTERPGENPPMVCLELLGARLCESTTRTLVCGDSLPSRHRHATLTEGDIQAPSAAMRAAEMDYYG